MGGGVASRGIWNIVHTSRKIRAMPMHNSLNPLNPNMKIEILTNSPYTFSIEVARGGDSHMKQTGMLVVSLRGINFGF